MRKSFTVEIGWISYEYQYAIMCTNIQQRENDAAIAIIIAGILKNQIDKERFRASLIPLPISLNASSCANIMGRSFFVFK